MRAVLGYLCLLAVFSLFLICVHNSLQEKRCRYLMAELLSEKLQRQREVSVERARVDELRRLERLEALCRAGQLPLGPPDLPALVVQLPPGSSNPTPRGVEEKESRLPDSTPPPPEHVALAEESTANGSR
jgi:hypothetical protein